MTRKKVVKRIPVKSWEQCNEALRQITELQSAIDVKIGAYNEDEAKRRLELDRFCNPIREKIEGLELGMQDFCEDNRADFGDKKSKELANGVVDFRLSTPSVKKTSGTWKTILELVSTSRFKSKYLRNKLELNKEQILADYAGQKITNEQLAEVCLSVEQDETFGYSVNYGAQKEAA